MPVKNGWNELNNAQAETWKTDYIDCLMRLNKLEYSMGRTADAATGSDRCKTI